MVNTEATPAMRMEMRQALIDDAVTEERARNGDRAARRLEQRLRAEAASTDERDRQQAAR